MSNRQWLSRAVHSMVEVWCGTAWGREPVRGPHCRRQRSWWSLDQRGATSAEARQGAPICTSSAAPAQWHYMLKDVRCPPQPPGEIDGCRTWGGDCSCGCNTPVSHEAMAGPNCRPEGPSGLLVPHITVSSGQVPTQIMAEAHANTRSLASHSAQPDTRRTILSQLCVSTRDPPMCTTLTSPPCLQAQR